MTPTVDQIWFFTKGIGPRSYLVEYRVRLKRIDRFDVTIPAGMADDPAAAELAAMHEVLVNRGVLGETRAGNRMKIVVSAGEIKEAARRATSKDFLVPMARFLTTRFSEAEIEVDHRGEWAEPGIARMAVQPLTAIENLGDIITLPGLGKAEISFHVIERLGIRYNVASLGAAWRMVVNVCLKGRLREEALAPERKLQMRAEHNVDARMFFDAESRMRLVVVPPESSRTGQAIIVTAYFERRPRLPA